MCNFCGYEHGIIGDVVCPVKQRFPTQYVSKYIHDFFTDTWPHYFEIQLPPVKFDVNMRIIDMTKIEFQEYMKTL